MGKANGMSWRSKGAGVDAPRFAIYRKKFTDGSMDIPSFAPLGRSIRNYVPELNWAQVGAGAEKMIGSRPSSSRMYRCSSESLV